MQTDWISTAEAAEASGYHPERVRELIREGKIRAVKKGNTWWVDRKSVLAYLKAAQKAEDKRYGPKID